MPIVCGVKFRGVGKAYYFSPGDVQDLRVGDHVIVETSRGKEMGEVALPVQEVAESKIVGQLRPVLRRATTADLLDAQHFQQQEAEAMARCKEQVAKLKLPMKITGAEYNYDGTRLTFFFTSEQRVDFRELVRELAYVFKTRIELRQIGVRDEAKMVGGLGKCGRPLCCATWLSEFCPVSIRMAKQQDLPLTPMEISGVCGRLLCCLEYENDYYQEIKGKFPKVGKTITSPVGTAKVIRVSVLRETVSLLLEDGTTLEITADQLEGKVPIERKENPRALSETQRSALNATLEAPPSLLPEEEDDREPAEKPRRGDDRQPHVARMARPTRPRPMTEQRTPSSETASVSPASAKPETEGAHAAERPPGRRSHRPGGPRPPSGREQARPGSDVGKQPPAGEEGASRSAEKRRRRPRRRRSQPKEGDNAPGEQKPTEKH